jgi:hypothetical protein
MHRQNRSLHYASLRSAPVGMTGRQFFIIPATSAVTLWRIIA